MVEESTYGLDKVLSQAYHFTGKAAYGGIMQQQNEWTWFYDSDQGG